MELKSEEPREGIIDVLRRKIDAVTGCNDVEFWVLFAVKTGIGDGCLCSSRNCCCPLIEKTRQENGFMTIASGTWSWNYEAMMLGLLESLHETRLVIQGRWLSCSWCMWSDGVDAAIGVMKVMSLVLDLQWTKTEVEGVNCNGGFDGAGSGYVTGTGNGLLVNVRNGYKLKWMDIAWKLEQ
ncbi:hypothetical protein C5167_014430 [Papaver somniferum]|uniref:Uncharacterized protein n=1 Tax=Papaver somniferum TaxID=3469 RepID=A0A4Y7J540_PAPSO|nr:hypothetical protein C5167_014430 [Papaver somniferum]